MNTDKYYFVNITKKEVFISDIRRRIPYSATNELFVLDANTYNRSHEIKLAVKAKLIEDVTDRVINNKAIELNSQKKEETNQVNTPVLNTTEEYTKSISDKGVYMVSDYESSRAFSGADKEQRMETVARNFRDGHSGSIMVDEYSPELMKIAKEKRSTIMVDADNRSNMEVDKRFSGMASRTDNRDYLKNSSIGQERLARQNAEEYQKRERANESDYRMNNSNLAENPLLSDEKFTEDFIGESTEDGLNPLLDSILDEVENTVEEPKEEIKEPVEEKKEDEDEDEKEKEKKEVKKRKPRAKKVVEEKDQKDTEKKKTVRKPRIAKK